MKIILFICFIAISFIFKNLYSKNKGYIGEKNVAKILSSLPSAQYKIINDILLESNGKTVQIDHLIISVYGIFVIETKNYKGRITGSDNSEYWMKNIYGNKYIFYNPIKQNEAHIFALKNRLNLSIDKFISIIVFSNEADLRVNTDYNVIYLTQIKKLIKEYTEIKFQKNNIQPLYEKISALNNLSAKARKRHVAEVNNIINTKQQLMQKGLCPRCKHSLVLKNGKYGDFWGCSNYPKCKFTKPIKKQNNYFLNRLIKKIIKSLCK